MPTAVSLTLQDLPAQDKIVKLVSISGQLDESNVDDQAKQMYDLIAANPKNLHLVLDLSGLEYMNSKSIGYLTDWYGKVTEGGGKVVISSARPNIADILNVVGLTQLITMYNTLDEAKFAVMQ